jgi:hypothetical protein
MGPGEQILQSEVATLDGAPVGQSHRNRIDFAVTGQALYAVDIGAGQAGRYPFEVIHSVFWRPDQARWARPFRIYFFDRESISSTIHGKAPSPLADLVSQRVAALVRFQRHVPLTSNGKGAVFQLRPINEKSIDRWVYVFDRGVDETTPGMDQALTDAIRGLDKELGRA